MTKTSSTPTRSASGADDRRETESAQVGIEADRGGVEESASACEAGAEKGWIDQEMGVIAEEASD